MNILWMFGKLINMCVLKTSHFYYSPCIICHCPMEDFENGYTVAELQLEAETDIHTYVAGELAKSKNRQVDGLFHSYQFETKLKCYSSKAFTEFWKRCQNCSYKEMT